MLARTDGQRENSIHPPHTHTKFEGGGGGGIKIKSA